MVAWYEAGKPATFEFTGGKKYEGEDLWKGNCISCGAKVVNYGNKGWEHPIVRNGKTTYDTYCPAETNS